MNSDGPDAVQQHGQNTENAPVEEIETHFPVQINQLSLINDSEGPGKFRGGLGMRRDYHFPKDYATFTILSDRDISGPKGIFGGLDGRKAYYILNPNHLSKKPKELTSKCVINVEPGDTVSFQTPGGGGYGNPKKRNPDNVYEDVINNKITYERAEKFYGVVINTKTNKIDNKRTIQKRKNK